VKLSKIESQYKCTMVFVQSSKILSQNKCTMHSFNRLQERIRWCE